MRAGDGRSTRIGSAAMPFRNRPSPQDRKSDRAMRAVAHQLDLRVAAAVQRDPGASFERLIIGAQDRSAVDDPQRAAGALLRASFLGRVGGLERTTKGNFASTTRQLIPGWKTTRVIASSEQAPSAERLSECAFTATRSDLHPRVRWSVAPRPPPTPGPPSGGCSTEGCPGLATPRPPRRRCPPERSRCR